MKFSVNAAVAAVETPPIAEAASWVRRSGRNRAFINLSQAVPSYPPAEELRQEVARRAMEDGTSNYTDILGIPELRRALAAHMSVEYLGSVTESDVAITAGANQAFCLAATALAAPGDNILLPSPYYFNHEMWLRMQAVEARCFDCVNEPGAVPAVEAAAARMDSRTRAIVLVSPNNPTGAIYPSQVLMDFYRLAQDRGIALVLDETYKDFRTEPRPPHKILGDRDWRETFVQLYSFSKAYALTGYRVGSVAAGPAFLAAVEKLADCVAICAPRISQYAALFGLERLGRWRMSKAAAMRERTAALKAAFATPGLNYELVSAGAYFAYVRHPFRGELSKTVAQYLAREHDLLVLPGNMFGPDQEDYLRVAFANVEAALMPEVATRLIESQAG